MWSLTRTIPRLRRVPWRPDLLPKMQQLRARKLVEVKAWGVLLVKVIQTRGVLLVKVNARNLPPPRLPRRRNLPP